MGSERDQPESQFQEDAQPAEWVSAERRVYPPSEVARRLQMSGQALRRLSATYERVCGELPRDERGRLWPEDDMERLDEARSKVRAGQAVSIEAALRAIQSGDQKASESYAVDTHIVAQNTTENQAVSFEELLAELRALRTAVERQNELLERQGERIAELEAGSGEPTDTSDESYEEPPQRHEPSEEGTPSETAAESHSGPQEQAEVKRSWWRRLFGR